jgi:hypothetical protein
MPPTVPIGAAPFALAIVMSLLFVRGWQKSLKVEWIVSLLLGSFTGFVAAFFEPLRTLDQDAVCGAGATLLHTEGPGDDGGTHHGFHCSSGQDSVLILVHVVACMMLMVGVFALGALVISAVRLRAKSAY